jgi:hypothetical protein
VRFSSRAGDHSAPPGSSLRDVRGRVVRRASTIFCGRWRPNESRRRGPPPRPAARRPRCLLAHDPRTTVDRWASTTSRRTAPTSWGASRSPSTPDGCSASSTCATASPTASCTRSWSAASSRSPPACPSSTCPTSSSPRRGAIAASAAASGVAAVNAELETMLSPHELSSLRTGLLALIDIKRARRGPPRLTSLEQRIICTDFSRWPGWRESSARDGRHSAPSVGPG